VKAFVAGCGGEECVPLARSLGSGPELQVPLGLLHLIRAGTSTVSVYQRIRLFVCANSLKTTDFDTYQEIPDTGHF